MNKEVVGNSWDKILGKEYEAEYFNNLRYFLRDEYKYKTIFPAKENIFNALKLTPPEKVKVVILGQDPYINYGEAHGLAFSVQPNVKIPPSLVNIFKELKEDIGFEMPKNGYLVPWAEQGVLLLNTTLTVEMGRSNSHAGSGWQKFTDAVIEYLGSVDRPIVFLLWGRNAKNKMQLIQKNPNHLILTAAHPSPLSAHNGFFGCKHFSRSK